MNETPARPRLPDDPRAREILLRRARRLANEHRRVEAPRERVAYLAVRLAGERYGLPYANLEEIVKPQGLTSLPGVPAHIAGILHRRGRLLTVLDLRPRLGLEAPAAGEEARVVVARGGGLHVGLWVDAVLDHGHYDAGELTPPLPSGGVPNTDHLLGIHAGQVTILNLDALLGDPTLRVEETVT